MPDRRGFLARALGVLAAPFVVPKAAELTEGMLIDLARAKRDAFYFWARTEMPIRHGKPYIGFLHHQAMMLNQMPKAHAIITDLKDSDLFECHSTDVRTELMWLDDPYE